MNCRDSLVRRRGEVEGCCVSTCTVCKGNCHQGGAFACLNCTCSFGNYVRGTPASTSTRSCGTRSIDALLPLLPCQPNLQTRHVRIYSYHTHPTKSDAFVLHGPYRHTVHSCTHTGSTSFYAHSRPPTYTFHVTAAFKYPGGTFHYPCTLRYAPLSPE